jgi:hypothetical protein
MGSYRVMAIEATIDLDQFKTIYLKNIAGLSLPYPIFPYFGK